MSNLKPVLIKDPRIIVDNERYFGVLKSGLRFRQKPWTTNSVSTSNIPFNTPAPSFDIFIDRRVYFSLGMRYRITCICQPGFAPINPNYDAPRAYPIHSMLNTITLTVNNATVTQYIGDIIHALLRLKNGNSLSEYDYSQSPTCLDVSQSYNDLIGSNRNPLSMAGDAAQGSIMGRGGFAGYKIILNPVNGTGGAVTSSAFVDIYSIEQLMFSPLEFGSLQKNASAFYNVNTMDWQFNFLGNPENRVWSHANSNAASQFVSNAIVFNDFPNMINPDTNAAVGTSFSFPQGSLPLLFINYITPDPVISKQLITRQISYPYFPVARYVTPGFAVNYGSPPAQMISNNIQLSNIPKKILIYARVTNNVYFSSPAQTDTFFAITDLSLQFQNYSGLLAESTQAQLWELARKNHVNIDWNSWSGLGQYQVGGAPIQANTAKYGGVGTLLVLEMGTDVQLDPEFAPGSIGQFNLQVTVNVKNIDPTTSHDNAQVDLYILCINDGVFTIPSGGVAYSELSLLDTKDVLEAAMQTDDQRLYLNYNDLQEISGGNFYTGIKDFGKAVGKKAMEANKFLRDNRIISKTAEQVNKLTAAPLIRDIPYASNVGNLAKDVRDVSHLLGYGKNGGSVLGAGRMSKHKLSDRLRNI